MIAPPSIAVKKRSGLPVWVWVVGLLVLLGLGAAAVVGGFALFIKPGSTPIAATATSPAVAVVDTPAATQSPIPAATVTTIIIPTEPTITALPPTATSTLPAVIVTPTLTATSQAKAPVIGEADKVAFVNANDVWIMNVDGSQLVQLTNDRANKLNLRWTPDGNSIVYISGKCIKIVDATSGRVDDINCFESAESVSAFEISPDGKQVAIVIDFELYIVPYDLTSLRQVKSRNGLTPLAPCKDITPLNKLIYQSVRWSSDGTKMAVTFKGVDNTRRVDLIRVMDVTKCNPDPLRLDEFPATRFTMSGYNANPLIPNFGWDGNLLFALNSYERNGGYGDSHQLADDDAVLRQQSQELNLGQ